MKFFVIKEAPNCWFWELRSADGQPVCKSATSFTAREGALDALKAVRSMAPRALVFDPLGTLYEGV